MFDHNGRGAIVNSLPASRALLLRGERTPTEDRDLGRILDFFAIPWKAVGVRGQNLDEQGNYAIVSSADALAELIHEAGVAKKTFPDWITKASAVYVYGFQPDKLSTDLLQFLTGSPQARIRRIQGPEALMTITGDAPGMCGPMSGMQVSATLRAGECVCEVGPGHAGLQSIVRTDQGEIFFGVACAGVRFYLNAAGGSVDIDTISPEYFDVKKFFCQTVPLIFYLRSVFPEAARGQGEINACLIVDDPPLKRRYGFLDFREALELMERHNFTTSIAFIPWNWQRTHPKTLDLFRRHPDRLSLVVHGCDHTAGEFAVRSPGLLNRMLQTSRQRMESFRQRASLPADSVMVFPQGEFSPETGRALKLNDFAAAVNTEVAPARGAANETTIADLWSIAIMKYGTFPIITRRYLHHGIENFAFDGLLGKPCLIASHHEIFRDHAAHLVEFVDRLNALKWNLVWRPLGEVVRRSFTVRHSNDGETIIRMFTCSLVVENSDSKSNTVLLKEEDDPDAVNAVMVNQTSVPFSVEGGYLRVPLRTPSGQAATVRVVYQKSPVAADPDSLNTNIKVAVKRYLSEFRDNYLSRNDFLLQTASRLKRNL